MPGPALGSNRGATEPVNDPPLSLACDAAPRHLACQFSLKSLIKGIAGAANGADRIGFTRARQGPAKTPDMNVNGALVDVHVTAPNGIQKLGAAVDAARRLHEMLEQAEFRGREGDVAASPGHASHLAVEGEIADGKDFGDHVGI